MSTMNPLKFVGGLVLEIGAVIAVLAIIPGLGGSEALRFSNAGGFSNANSSLPANSFATTPVTPASLPNEVFFDAQSPRVLDNPTADRRARPTMWQNDLVPPPPVAQQRYVEEMLDHSSQRALDAAARVWSQGDRLLPPEMRVRREAPMNDLATKNDRTTPQHEGEPIRDLGRDVGTRRQVPEFRTEEYRPNDYRPNDYRPTDYRPTDYRNSDEIVPEYVVPPTTAERNYNRPSHYAPAQANPVQGNPAPNFAPSRYLPPRYSAQEQPHRFDQRY